MDRHAAGAVRAADRPGPAGMMLRVGLFAALWWLLTGAAAGAWWVGAPVVLAAAWTSRALWWGRALSARAALAFLPWFALRSLAGALDVAQRALDPAMPLDPGLVRHRLWVPAGAPRVAVANVVSLLPGTLSAVLEDDRLVVHALDAGPRVAAAVREIEARIGRIFRAREPAGWAR